MRAAVRFRFAAMGALALPVLAGLTYMAAQSAPSAYLAIDGTALVLALLWLALAPVPESLKTRRIITITLLALLFVPLATGPSINGITRWLPLGPLTIHAGFLALPPLTVLAARDRDFAAPILLVAVLAALLQPDAGTGFAVIFAAVGLHHVGRDWKVAAVCVIGFFAAISMALRGQLPPQPFVERVLFDAAHVSPVIAALLALALFAGFALVLWASPLARIERFALAGSLFGFIVIAMMSHYPFPFIGHGAAPIIGYGLALGLSRTVPA